MDFDKKCGVTYVALSIAFPLMAEGMKANGVAVSGNPAWQLISTIRNIFICSWVLLLVLTVIHVGMSLVRMRNEVIAEREAEKRAEAQKTKTELDSTRRWIDTERDRLKALEARLEKREEERLAAWNVKWRELEEKQSRTSEDAVDLAMEDFA